MLGIVDYGAGNQTSVARALQKIGAPCLISSDCSQLAQADGLIFPGVGSAGQAMQHLRSSGLVAFLKEAVAMGQPLLGICLGCQILLEHTEEADTRTLGLAQGQCYRFANDLREADGAPIRVPHMGWNSLNIKRSTRLLEGIGPDDEFYFVHSYYVEPDPALALATTIYGREFCSVYGRDGLWAVQFHAEKSGEPGLRILKNFQNYCSEKANAV